VIKLLRYQFLLFVLALTNMGVAQTILDDFTDGNFTTNPVWTINSGSASITSNALVFGGGTSNVSMSTPLVTDCQEWSFKLQSSTNFNKDNFRFYFVLLNNPAPSNSVSDGYCLDYDGDNGDFIIYRLDNGVLTSLSSYNGSTSSLIRTVRITMNASGNIVVVVSGTTIMSITSTTYPASSSEYIGITCNGDDSDAGDFFSVDDINYVAACFNPTSAGTIANAQSSCGSFNPATITSSVLPSGHTGTLEYKWQQSTTSSSSGFSDISSTDATTYDPSTISQTTWYKRLSRVTCSADWSGAIESNVIEMTVNSSITISTNPVNDTVYINSCGFATFNVSLSSGNSPGYQWQVSTDNGSSWSSLVNSSIYSGVATTQLKVNASSNTFNGYRYRCVVTNSCGSATSGSARLAVISWTKNIVINEIMIQPPSNNCHADQALLIKSNYTQAGPPMECDGVSVTTSSGKEWVELYNPYCSAIDVSNWFIATRSSLTQSHGVFRIPAGTSISANGFLTIGGAASSASLKLNAFSASNVLTENSLRFYLDNNDGWLGLYGPEGNPVDAVFWTFSAGESSKWGTDSDISFAPTLIPSGSSGAPLVTDSLPGPKSVCLSAVKDYIGVVTNSKTLERSIDGAGSWQVSDNSGGASLGTTNNVAQTCTSLPIELLSFDAQLENKATHLTWETASERNNDFFAVERSPNGIDWDVLELIDGAGSSAELLSYETYDNYPLKVISYYRLKQTDFDGKARYSAIKSISNTEDLMVLPNPGNGIFYVSGLSERKENQVLVMDVTGKTIANYKTEDAMLQMNLEDHPAGIYYVKVNEEFTMKIVKWAND
jgi:hypothetical protein